jgi:transposase InsO family protein
VYLAVVVDAWSRRVIGWSIADHMRAELVVDALQMAIWRRRPPAGQTVHHSDHGAQYTSWAFGRRLRAAGVLGSMGTVGDALDCEHDAPARRVAATTLVGCQQAAA